MATNAPKMTMEQELQIIRLVQRSYTWNRYLPSGAQTQASFFKFPLDPSPTASDEEAVSLNTIGTVLPKSPLENVIGAGVFMSNCLNQYLPTSSHAIGGGLALNIRGVPRYETSGVDIYYRGHTGTLLRLLIQNTRIILPDKLFPSEVLPTYIRTGPTYQDPECASDHLVKTNLILSGLLSAGFQRHIIDFPLQIAGQTHTLRTLDVIFLMISKIRAWVAKERPKDYIDALALMREYAEEIKAKKRILDPVHTRKLVEEMVRKRESSETINWAKELLLTSRNRSPQSGERTGGN